MDASQWNALLATQQDANPFMRHEYLAALHESAAARAKTGWTPRFMTLWRGDCLEDKLGEQLVAACPLYIKAHSYGEYVFDWAWANAYQQHGLNYYPKAVVAVPFTPVPGARLMAHTQADREALVQALIAWCGNEKLSSLHLLFANEDDIAACATAGLMLRHTVQFHWVNVAPTLVTSPTTLALQAAPLPESAPLQAVPACADRPQAAARSPERANFSRGGPSKHSSPIGRTFNSFDEFLASLSQEKRKKIRQERRKVADAGVRFRWSLGADIATADWDFFYRCYERTYLEHGNAPYLSRDFFQRMADTMPQNWLLFVAERHGEAIATSLIAIDDYYTRDGGKNSSHSPVNFDVPDDSANHHQIAYGRYWGALERVDCLHFEACYYQPLQWCIEQGYQRFEGGAQGEHKMARALMPVITTSAHWLAQPAFADAVERFLAREGEGIDTYMDGLSLRSPFRCK